MKRQRNTTQMKKHRSPNKWKGNRQTTWKIIQNNDSKNDQNPWKQNGESAKPINKELEELKNKHAETNATNTEIKNTP